MAMTTSVKAFQLEMIIIQATNEAVEKYDRPAPTSYLKMLGADRKTLRNMVHEGTLVQVHLDIQGKRLDPRKGVELATSRIENGYYVAGGAVPSAIRKRKPTERAASEVDNKDASEVRP